MHLMEAFDDLTPEEGEKVTMAWIRTFAEGVPVHQRWELALARNLL